MSVRKNNEEFCGSLPLHLINHIQDYGVLLVVDREETIIQASANYPQLIRHNSAELIGSKLGTILSDQTYSVLPDC